MLHNSSRTGPKRWASLVSLLQLATRFLPHLSIESWPLLPDSHEEFGLPSGDLLCQLATALHPGLLSTKKDGQLLFFEIWYVLWTLLSRCCQQSLALEFSLLLLVFHYILNKSHHIDILSIRTILRRTGIITIFLSFHIWVGLKDDEKLEVKRWKGFKIQGKDYQDGTNNFVLRVDYMTMTHVLQL